MAPHTRMLRLAPCVTSVCIMSAGAHWVSDSHAHASHCVHGRICSCQWRLWITILSSIGYYDSTIVGVHVNGKGLVIWLMAHISSVPLPGAIPYSSTKHTHQTLLQLWLLLLWLSGSPHWPFWCTNLWVHLSVWLAQNHSSSSGFSLVTTVANTSELWTPLFSSVQ